LGQGKNEHELATCFPTYITHLSFVDTINKLRIQTEKERDPVDGTKAKIKVPTGEIVERYQEGR
jgi:hypothetical protein